MVKRLKKKFVIGAMAAVSLVILIMMVALNTANWIQLNGRADALIQVLEENEGTFPKAEPPKGEEKPPGREPGFSVETPYEIRYFTVTLKEDGTVESIDTGKIAAVSTSEAAQLAERIFQDGTEEGYEGQYRFHRKDGEDGIRLTFVDCSRELRTFRNFLSSSVLLSAAGLMAVFVLVRLFARMVLRPVSESYEKQKQFITDASHEIKTPLAIIRADTEVLELEQGESEWTDSIKNQISRLTSLTESLILLSRMEEGSQKKESFSLSDVVSDAVHTCLPLAAANEKELCAKIQPDLFFHGEARSFHQLTLILVENAVKYADPCGKIEVILRKAGKRLILEVKNPAGGVEESDLPNLFDRFFRGDKSRSSRTAGHGIGLSAARAIAEAHGGQITASKEPNEILRIVVLLPQKG